ARTLLFDRDDMEAGNDMIAGLRDAESFPCSLKRHALVVAGRESLRGGGKWGKLFWVWIRERGCDYMKLAWDADLVDEPGHEYYFAKFLCYVRARLRGHDAIIMDELLPGGELSDAT